MLGLDPGIVVLCLVSAAALLIGYVVGRESSRVDVLKIGKCTREHEHGVPGAGPCNGYLP